MRGVKDDPGDQGVTTVMIALMFTCLVAAAGLGIDSSSLAFHRSRIQHSADAGARAIAYDCVTDKPCNAANAGSTADYFATKNSSGGTTGIPGGVSKAAGKVIVTVHKPVETNFFGALGIDSKNVDATATAIWKKNASAATVIPFAASICEYAKVAHKTATFISTNINDLVKDLKKSDKESKLGAGGGNLNLLTTCSRPSDVPSSQVPALTLGVMKGGLWIPKNDGSNAYCDGKIHMEVFQVQTHIAGKNANCIANKWGPDLAALVGKNMLMAIYAPARNYSYGGVASNPAGLVGTGNANISDQSGDFLIKIIGFAPFHVTGFCLEGTSRCAGATTGPDRINGYFIGSPEEFEDIEFGDNGTNFGAVKIELVE